jgi:hypothetical protein
MMSGVDESDGATLAEWLLAQLDEDERVARGAVRWSEGAAEWASVGEPDYEHIARHDPARVLAEVAAKRLQIEQTFRYEAKIDGEWGCCHTSGEIRSGACEATPVNEIEMLRLLALPYADRPGYRQDWAP